MFLENHTLYLKPECPYCVKVMRWAQQHDISFATANTHDAENACKLIEMGGKRQVPCMIIGGKALYESNDIIAYLEGLLR